MKRYTIKQEFLSNWGEDCTEETIITAAEVERLAEEWEKPVKELLEQLEEAETTCGEHFTEHEDENLGWCKPYRSGEHAIIVNGGEVDYIAIDGVPQEVTPDAIRTLAKTVNDDYDIYQGWSDLHIALDAMKEVGCASCPCFAECEAMHETCG